MKKFLFILVCSVFCACAMQFNMPENFAYVPVQTNHFKIASWQKISNKNQPVHIYIEGDGRAFYANGAPSADPTPRDSFLRNLSVQDSADNVIYVARPCQFIRDTQCNFHDWTDGRFSQKIIVSVSDAIRQIAQGRPVILIGYSGGALLSGLIVQQNHDIKIQKWITIAGVLNHRDWTSYFGDSNLTTSVDLEKIPNVPQIHYVAENDSVVPMELSQKWISPDKLKIIPNATHNNFPNLEINFD